MRARYELIGLAPLIVCVVVGGCGGGGQNPTDASAADAGILDAGGLDVGAEDAGDVDAGERSDAGDANARDVSEAGTADAGDSGRSAHIFDPAAANPGVWTWIPIEGAHCRDGSQAGLGLRIRPGSPGLIIFMHGGGGCLDATSCAQNRASFGGADLADWAAGLGDNHIFNPDNVMNPVRNWNAAFIAYCTGDLHGGTRTGVNVPGGPRNQSFVGHLNMARMTALLRDYFRGVDHVLLAGSSAGGFGTVLNYVQVTEAFAPTRVTLLDDSGPFAPTDQAFAPCLQRQIRDLWGLDAALPAACTACFSATGDGLSNLFPYLGNTYPLARFGLVSTTGDVVIRTFYGYGRNACDPALALPVTVDDYTTGLFALRSILPSNWGTYYSSGSLHAILALFPVLSVNGVTLSAWTNELVAGRVSHVAPP